jgi:hypothetical protein
MKKPKASYPSVREPSPEVVAKLLGEPAPETPKVEVTRTLKRLSPKVTKLETKVQGARKPRTGRTLTDGRVKVQLAFHLSPDIHRRLRLQAALEDQTMSDIVQRVLDAGLDK